MRDNCVNTFGGKIKGTYAELLSFTMSNKVSYRNKFGQTHHAEKSCVAKILTVDTVSKLWRSEPTCRHLSSSAGHRQRTMRLISLRKADYSCLGRPVLNDCFLSFGTNSVAMSNFTLKWKYESCWKAVKSDFKLELRTSEVNYCYRT